MPPPSTYPTLKALKTIEAVIRLKSLTRAAGELNLSVSAVAFQVDNAELVLGAKLVERRGRGLAVSPEAEEMAAQLRAGFETVDKAVERMLLRGKRRRSITVGMLPSFATLWFLPRLHHFSRFNPAVDIRISATERRSNLAEESIDCAIRCGSGAWEGVDAQLLFPQRLAPVCHRSYLQKHGRVRSPKDLKNHIVIIDEQRADEWDAWFASFGLDQPKLTNMQKMEGRDLAFEGVAAGMGIGLLDVSLIRSQLQTGDLVQLSGPSLETGWGHYLLRPAGKQHEPHLSSVLDWIVKEAGAAAEPKHSGGVL